MITRSGGNAFSGAFRLNLTNPAWAVETPFEKSRATTRASKLSPTYEATSGGPLVRDRLWYFGGARVERTTTQSAFAQTGVPYTSRNENTRYEAKLTGSPHNGHTVQGSFINNATDLASRRCQWPSIRIRSRRPRRPTGSWVPRGAACSGRGRLRRLSTRRSRGQLQNAGGSSTAVVDSPFMTRGTLGVPGGLLYNAPYFDSTDPEQRNNRQFTASAVAPVCRPRGLERTK